MVAIAIAVIIAGAWISAGINNVARALDDLTEALREKDMADEAEES